MGIFIEMHISDSVTQEEWDPVYEKSLFMAKEFGFYNIGYKMIHGEKLGCIFLVEEITDEEKPQYDGWEAVGSLPEYKDAETQFTPKYVRGKSNPVSKTDALVSKIGDLRGDYNYEMPCWDIWYGKTQGEPYHMGLLAIGCMIEQELGIQAIVDGDITYGQCKHAAEMASDILGTEIRLPICCRLNDLYERANNMAELSETEKVKFLYYYYLGEQNSEFGEFLKTHFSREIITAFWQELFNEYKEDEYVFGTSGKAYFRMGFSLDGYCELAEFNRADPKNCRELIESILKTSMHIKEKDCEDLLDYKKAEGPYSIHRLMVSVFMRGAANPAIDRYIPIDEMRETFKKHFRNIIDVDEVIDNYLQKEEESTEKKPHEKLKEMIDAFSEVYQEKHDTYDVCEYDELYKYKKGSTISPSLAEAVEGSFRFYCSAAKDEEYETEKVKSSEEIFCFIASRFRSHGLFYLHVDHWEKIYNDLQRDKNCFYRYYPITRVKAERDLKHLARAFVANDDFWNYCCENFSKEK